MSVGSVDADGWNATFALSSFKTVDLNHNVSFVPPLYATVLDLSMPYDSTSGTLSASIAAQKNAQPTLGKLAEP